MPRGGPRAGGGSVPVPQPGPCPPAPCAPLRTAPSTASRTQAQGWPGARPSQLGRGWLGDWCSPKAESPMKALTLLVLEGRTRRFLLTLTHLRTFTTFSQWKGTGQGLGLQPLLRVSTRLRPSSGQVLAGCGAVSFSLSSLAGHVPKTALYRALQKPLNSVYSQALLPSPGNIPVLAAGTVAWGRQEGVSTCTFLFCKQKSCCRYPRVLQASHPITW